MEDACLLCPENDVQHINVVDTLLKDVEFQWKITELHLFIDSACVHGWISDILLGKTRICTKASNEMHILRLRKNGQ